MPPSGVGAITPGERPGAMVTAIGRRRGYAGRAPQRGDCRPEAPQPQQAAHLDIRARLTQERGFHQDSQPVRPAAAVRHFLLYSRFSKHPALNAPG
ncbi:hypothetical protein QNH14_15505 [Apirhabdus apintestini]|nr:hypothetical protein QNH14_15505 [Enterobacteriaceae bacterium CA-0114]